MRTKSLMLAGAGAIALTGGAVLAPVAMADPIPPAASYADLLEPVPDAMERIHADDAMGSGDARVVPAGINIDIGIGHHHHHHHAARWYREHGFFWNGRVWVQGPPPPPMYWHNHHQDWYRAHGYTWNGQIWVLPPPPVYWHNHHRDWYRARGYSWDGRVWVVGRAHHHHHHHHHHQQY